MFAPATKSKQKARIAIDGPTGAGKTFTTLLTASHLGERVAVIDTERGRASLYSDKFKFDVVELTSHHPKKYIEAIKAAGAAGYDVLVIDSLSHAWNGVDGCLELVDKASAASQSNNNFGAWRKVTPLHNELIDTILQSPCHVLVTMRCKMEVTMEKDEKTGKTSVVRKGLQPIQRDGVEYEFDIIGDMDINHTMVISKTRCFDLDGAVLHKPGKELAESLLLWLNSGAEPAPAKVELPEGGKSTSSAEPATTTTTTTSTAGNAEQTSTTSSGETATDPKSAKGGEENPSTTQNTDAAKEQANTTVSEADQSSSSAQNAAPATTDPKPAATSTNSEPSSNTPTASTAAAGPIAEESAWTACQTAGKPNNWLLLDILRYAMETYLPGVTDLSEVKKRITVDQARDIHKHVSKNKFVKKEVAK